MTSLYQLQQICQTKIELQECLQPAVRQITLEQTSSGMDIKENITTILSMTLQAIEQHGEFIEVQMLHEKQCSVSEPKYRHVKLPLYGKPSRLCQYNIRNMAILLTLLCTIKERYSSNHTSTVRDVFYSNVELYRTQSTISHWLHIIATNFKVKEVNTLNIVPAQKGLVYSTISLEFEGNTILQEGSIHLIPYINNKSMIRSRGLVTNRVTIRIFEKEAIFNKVAQNLKGSTLQEIIITGKGYPDTLTKTLVQRLNQLLTSQNLLIYVDADPYGINIALSYFTNCQHVDRLKYMGVTIVQLVNKGGQLLSMSPRDYCMARTTLDRVIQSINSSNTQCEKEAYSPMRQELQRQLFLGKKGEMNALYV